MKKCIIALLTVVLTLCWAVTPALALDKPYNSGDPIPSGDDHPWGGDGANPPTSSRDNDRIVTHTSTTNDFIGQLFVRYFYYDFRQLFDRSSRVPEKHSVKKDRSVKNETAFQTKERRR